MVTAFVANNPDLNTFHSAPKRFIATILSLSLSLRAQSWAAGKHSSSSGQAQTRRNLGPRGQSQSPPPARGSREPSPVVQFSPVVFWAGVLAKCAALSWALIGRADTDGLFKAHITVGGWRLRLLRQSFCICSPRSSTCGNSSAVYK